LYMERKPQWVEATIQEDVNIPVARGVLDDSDSGTLYLKSGDKVSTSIVSGQVAIKCGEDTFYALLPTRMEEVTQQKSPTTPSQLQVASGLLAGLPHLPPEITDALEKGVDKDLKS
jgi:hypothetical protein